MRLIDRHIGGAVILGTLAVLLVLLTLVGFVELEQELDDVGKGDYRVLDVLLYVLLILPRVAYQVFPVAALVGSLFGLGILARHSELVAMRAAGVSLAHIVWAVMKAGLVIVIVAAVVGELLAPASEQLAQRMRAEKLYGQITLKTKYGFWARDGRSFINIRRILPGARLGEIFIFEYDQDQRLRLATHAEEGLYQGDRWLLRGIEQSELVDDGVRTRRLEKASWTSLLDPGLLSVVMVDPLLLPAAGLHKLIVFMRENEQNPKTYEIAFWSRVINPLGIFVMLFLSVPFVVGNLRSVGLGQRVLTGAVVGSGLLLLNTVSGHFAVVYDLSPLFAAALPTVLFLFLALWLARRV